LAEAAAEAAGAAAAEGLRAEAALGRAWAGPRSEAAAAEAAAEASAWAGSAERLAAEAAAERLAALAGPGGVSYWRRRCPAFASLAWLPYPRFRGGDLRPQLLDFGAQSPNLGVAVVPVAARLGLSRLGRCRRGQDQAQSDDRHAVSNAHGTRSFRGESCVAANGLDALSNLPPQTPVGSARPRLSAISHGEWRNAHSVSENRASARPTPKIIARSMSPRERVDRSSRQPVRRRAHLSVKTNQSLSSPAYGIVRAWCFESTGFELSTRRYEANGSARRSN
jgi:hypothetical protein